MKHALSPIVDGRLEEKFLSLVPFGDKYYSKNRRFVVFYERFTSRVVFQKEENP